MLAAQRIDQLRVDAHAPSGAPGAAFQQVAHAKLPGDGAHVHGLALVGKDRVARDDKEARDPGEIGDQVFGQAVGERVLLGIAAQIDEGQHGDRWFVGQRQGFACGVGPFDGTCEAVADARHRGDPFTATGRRTKQLPELRDLDGEIAFLDRGARPGCVHQFGLGQDFAWTRDEGLQQLQPAMAGGDGNIAPEQRSRTRIKHERSESEARSLHAAIYSRFGSFENYLGRLNYAAGRLRHTAISIKSRVSKPSFDGGCHER